MDDGTCETIRDTPLGACIGHVLLDITAEDVEEFLADPKHRSRVYFHFANGQTMFCTIGRDGDGLLGMLGMENEESDV